MHWHNSYLVKSWKVHRDWYDSKETLCNLYIISCVFLYQTRPFPTYPTHLYSTGSTREVALQTTACSLTFSRRCPCRRQQLLVMCLCSRSLTSSLLPVFSLAWYCGTEKPWDTNILLVHRKKWTLFQKLYENTHIHSTIIVKGRAWPPSSALQLSDMEILKSSMFRGRFKRK